MRYYFKPDVFVVVINILCLGLLVYLWVSAGTSPFSYWLPVIVTLIFSWVFAKMPLYTYLDEDTIRVKQVVGEVTFRRSEVTLHRLTNRDFDGLIRSFGSGGLGGYIGYFQNQRLGRFFMLAVSRTDLALVSTLEGKQYVIHYPPQG
jgi:hypothetical protein